MAKQKLNGALYLFLVIILVGILYLGYTGKIAPLIPVSNSLSHTSSGELQNTTTGTGQVFIWYFPYYQNLAYNCTSSSPISCYANNSKLIPAANPFPVIASVTVNWGDSSVLTYNRAFIQTPAAVPYSDYFFNLSHTYNCANLVANKVSYIELTVNYFNATSKSIYLNQSGHEFSNYPSGRITIGACS